MSYEKVKCITRKPKEGKIFVTSACNNVTPSTYHRWEFMADSNDYHEKELELMRSINGGGLSLNPSCYDWNYAYYKTREEMIRRYGTYNLYELSEMNYPTYYLDKGYRDTDTTITADELKNGNYVLDYESRDGTIKSYYKQEEYNATKEKRTKVLEEYYTVFNEFLKEKRTGEYYLYSERYGYVTPKGLSGSFYYSEYTSLMEILDYKKAYCLSQIIGRDIEVRAVPTREYEPTQAQIEEAKIRMELCGLKDIDSLSMSDTHYLKKAPEKDVKIMNAINEFEKEYNSYVYHIIITDSSFGRLLSMLYVSNHQEEWTNDKEDLRNNETYAYVYNVDDPILSEIGLIGISKDEQYNLLKRTY